MKKILMLTVLACTALMLNSCSWYDEPGDELEMNQKLYQYDIIYKVNYITAGFNPQLGDVFRVEAVNLATGESEPIEQGGQVSGGMTVMVTAQPGPGRMAIVTVNGEEVPFTPYLLLDNTDDVIISAVFM